MQISDFIDEICLVGGHSFRHWRLCNTLIYNVFLAKRRYFVNDIDRLVFTKSFAVIRRSSPSTHASGWGQEWGQTSPDLLCVNERPSQMSKQNGPICSTSTVNGTGRFGSICAETDPLETAEAPTKLHPGMA